MCAYLLDHRQRNNDVCDDANDARRAQQNPIRHHLLFI